MNPLQYVAIAFAVMLIALGVKYNMLESDYDELVISNNIAIELERDKIRILEAKEAVSLASEATYISVIGSLNEVITKGEIDITAKNKELAMFRNKPPEEKYKKLYEQLKSIEETENDCERYEDTSIAFDNFNLNEL